MKRVGPLFLLLTILIFGCQGQSSAPPLEPLTVADWKGMPANTKFEADTMERLKLGEPKFQNDEQWDRFVRTVFIPARKRELPDKDKKPSK